MTWENWVSAVLQIARDRGINCQVTYPRPGWATFTWQCQNGSRFGTAGAGQEFIYLTTPEQFTWLWTCEVTQNRPETPNRPDNPFTPEFSDVDLGRRKGRYVPRVPAMAVADALRELFK